MSIVISRLSFRPVGGHRSCIITGPSRGWEIVDIFLGKRGETVKLNLDLVLNADGAGGWWEGLEVLTRPLIVVRDSVRQLFLCQSDELPREFFVVVYYKSKARATESI
jgi:hypothetical protein